MAGFLPIDALLHLTNIGTLFAFVVVCAAVLIMRWRYPDHPRLGNSIPPASGDEATCGSTRS